jgi:hypothetical protein
VFKKGDLVKLICPRRDTWGVPLFVLWYLVTKDSQDGYCDAVVVNAECCTGSAGAYVSSVGDIDNLNDDDIVPEKDLSLMVVSKYDL